MTDGHTNIPRMYR